MDWAEQGRDVSTGRLCCVWRGRVGTGGDGETGADRTRSGALDRPDRGRVGGQLEGRELDDLHTVAARCQRSRPRSAFAIDGVRPVNVCLTAGYAGPTAVRARWPQRSAEAPRSGRRPPRGRARREGRVAGINTWRQGATQEKERSSTRMVVRFDVWSFVLPRAIVCPRVGQGRAVPWHP